MIALNTVKSEKYELHMECEAAPVGRFGFTVECKL